MQRIINIYVNSVQKQQEGFFIDWQRTAEAMANYAGTLIREAQPPAPAPTPIAAAVAADAQAARKPRGKRAKKSESAA